MSRNGSGTYTWPANSFNPAVADTEIDANDWNTSSADIATAVTQSIATDGQTTTTASIPFAAGVTINNTGLKVYDTDASHTLAIVPGSNITANRVFTITTGDANRTLSMAGNLTFAGSVTSSGAFPLTLTVDAATSLALPNSFGTGIRAFLSVPSSANLATAVTNETGSGALVFATSPTLVTPTLGVATATSINKVALTAPAAGATLTIADGKTLTASNTLALTGTDSSSIAFGAGGTIGAVGYATTGQIPGISSNTAASAGNIGEIISSTVTAASPVAFTAGTGNDQNITSITLTAGDWDVCGQASASTGDLTFWGATLGTTSGTLGAGELRATTVNGGTSQNCASLVPRQFTVASGTQVIYMVGRATFPTTAPGMFGFLKARRVR